MAEADSRRATDPAPLTTEELDRDASIRPGRLTEFIGQTSVTENLRVYIDAARRRKEPLDHLLLSGMPGLGKTTLAHLIAVEMGTGFRATSGPVLEKAKDLVGILTELEAGDVLFIDEVHRLSRVVEEYLYSAMEDFQIDILIDQGPNARSVRIDLPKFTLVAATTREGNLTSPFRARFGIQEKLEPYGEAEMREILTRSASILGIGLAPAGAKTLSSRCRGTPRIANRYLRRVRDFAEISDCTEIDGALAEKALSRLGVDELGLDALDRKILEVIGAHRGEPVGVKTIAVSVGEEERTIEDVYEPYLIRRGYLSKTPRGRLLGPKADEVPGLELPPPASERLVDRGLFEEEPTG